MFSVLMGYTGLINLNDFFGYWGIPLSPDPYLASAITFTEKEAVPQGASPFLVRKIESWRFEQQVAYF